MTIINEVRPPENVMLSNTQKFILTKFKLPDTNPQLAYENTSSSTNVVANRDQLVKLGMIELGQNQAQITELGDQALQNENLIDDMGGLTPQGEEYAYAETVADADKVAAQNMKDANTPDDQTYQPEEPNAQQPTEIAGQQEPGTPSIESWSMIAAAQIELSEKVFIQKHLKK